ncbi:hypothetical protein [Streptomyces sp. NPDC005865]|uniref:hypothetical protein n=1 Tax=Streptomyces sp. NPDC005865 TaxID=3155453 RepID=UPI0033E9B690
MHASPVVFSVLMSLAPPAAALAGLLVLGQALTHIQWLAMVLVVLACGGSGSGAPGAVRAGGWSPTRPSAH